MKVIQVFQLHRSNHAKSKKLSPLPVNGTFQSLPRRLGQVYLRAGYAWCKLLIHWYFIVNEINTHTHHFVNSMIFYSLVCCKQHTRQRMHEMCTWYENNSVTRFPSTLALPKMKHSLSMT